MLFNSVAFIFFFLVVTTLYFLGPFKFRWIILLISSCYFYMAFVPIYILILGFTIIVDYWAGICIEKSEGHIRKVFLVCSLLSNIGVLAVFKYYNFVIENITIFTSSLGFHSSLPYLKILLPIGLSFHTFQAMSYTIEVYRGHQKAEKNFGTYSLYVMFYPQLVAGPIERPQNLIHQFKEEHSFDYDNIVSGLEQMLWGFFKKLVIADRLAIYVNAVYNHPLQHTGTTILVATVFFSFQIYCDFSGYSDIAIGAAKVMGFKLMTNFNRPFSSKNVTEYWRRWHISLSTWFNDYFFSPLALNYRSLKKSGVVLALMSTFFISGLWHGAGFTFIIFGLLHGIAVSFEFLTTKTRRKISRSVPKFLYNNLSVALTFAFVTLAFVFFRANSLTEAFIIVQRIFTSRGPLFITSPPELIYSVFGIFLLIIIESRTEYQHNVFSLFYHQNWVVKNLAYISIIVLILLFGVFDGGQFIYFQF